MLNSAASSFLKTLSCIWHWCFLSLLVDLQPLRLTPLILVHGLLLLRALASVFLNIYSVHAPWLYELSQGDDSQVIVIVSVSLSPEHRPHVCIQHHYSNVACHLSQQIQKCISSSTSPNQY